MYLSRHFPDGGRRGNVLYLVSSSLPRGAVAWARAARAKKIAFVLNQNGVAFPAWASEAEMARVNGRNAELAELASHVVFQSRFCQEAFGRWVGREPASSSVIYNPIDPDFFAPVTTAHRRVQFLLMGSVAQPERVRLPLEMLSLAKRAGHHWTLRVAGKFHWPDAEQAFGRWITELGLESQVERTGPYRQADAPALYSGADVLLHLQDKDASPTVPLEALACGCPVVGLRSGGVPELIPPSTGKLIAVAEGWDRFHYPTAPELLAAAADVLESRARMGSSGRHWVREHFALEGFVRKHQELFARVT